MAEQLYSPLRWIGGKQRIVPHLKPLTPPLEPTVTYWEPFLGGASLFLALRPFQSKLSDINPDLVRCYSDIQAHPGEILRELKQWGIRFSKGKYAQARSEFNRLKPSSRRSALFLILNRTCFNGIWRVSRSGKFNVPYGKKQWPEIPGREELLSYSEVFKDVEFLTGDFVDALSECKRNDFVYLDPPYPPLNGTAFFTHYAKGRFSLADQNRVAIEVARLTARGCRVMVSNAGVEMIRNLFRGYRIAEVPTTRYVAAGGVRHKVQDIAIMNYDEAGKILSHLAKSDTEARQPLRSPLKGRGSPLLVTENHAVASGR
jgi:DNA adenine methylase